MKKIPSLFVRDFGGNPRYVTRTVDPQCEWVFRGEGVATRKLDGTSVLVRGGQLFRRYDAKHGKKPPPDFEPAQDADPVTGHWPGWIPARSDRPENRWHVEAFANTFASTPPVDGTYELVGPKIHLNPEGYEVHTLVPHGSIRIAGADLSSYDAIRVFLAANEMEGIVWHHPDGERFAKIKTNDFEGLAWPRPKPTE